MNLLFITQKVDKDDDLLGVYHEWIKRLAPNFQKISVICLYKGEHELPSNVKVFSLGKESGHSRIKYLRNFYKYIWQLKKEYDAVFVHMNPEYVILSGLLWRLWGKKIILWHAHYLDTFKLRIASFLSHKIFSSVKLAFPFDTPKLQILQQGIDIDKFKMQNSKCKIQERINILFLGRISPIKNLHILIDALNILKNKNINFHLDIVGDYTDKKYYDSVKKQVESSELSDKTSFLGRVSHNQTPEIYSNHDIFVNLTDTGSFDKTILEAMACGSLVLVSNRAFENIFSQELKNILIFKEKDVSDLTNKIQKILNLPSEKIVEMRENLRNIIIEQHSLDKLIDKLTNAIKETN